MGRSLTSAISEHDCSVMLCHSMPLHATRRRSTPLDASHHCMPFTPLRATRCHFNWHGVTWSGTRGQVAWSGMEWHIQNDPGLHVPCENNTRVCGEHTPAGSQVGLDMALMSLSGQNSGRFPKAFWNRILGSLCRRRQSLQATGCPYQEDLRSATALMQE